MVGGYIIIQVLIKGVNNMIEAIVMFGWTFIMLVVLAIITSLVGDNLND